jgi:hypothetical protein
MGEPRALRPCRGCRRGDKAFVDEAGVTQHEHWDSPRSCTVYRCRAAENYSRAPRTKWAPVHAAMAVGYHGA